MITLHRKISLGETALAVIRLLQAAQWASDIYVTSIQETWAKKQDKNSFCHIIAERAVWKNTGGTLRAIEKNMCREYFRSPITEAAVRGKTVCMLLIQFYFDFKTSIAWENISVFINVILHMRKWGPMML